MKILVYDFETSGMPLWHEPSDDPRQPHPVQVAAKLMDGDAACGSLNVLVKPESWEINPEATAVHGITQEDAEGYGIPEPAAMVTLFSLWRASDCRLGFNESFDARIMRIWLKRMAAGGKLVADSDASESFRLADTWKAGKALCACQLASDVMKMPATVAMKRTGRGKQSKKPKLTEAYEYLMGRPLENAHDAMVDVEATWAIFQNLALRNPKLLERVA